MARPVLRPAFAALALLSAAAPLALAPAASAQAEPMRSEATLSLSATGSVSVAPDQARVTAGVVSRADTAAAAVRENAQTMQAVFAALRRAGVAEADLQTARLNVNPVYANQSRSSSDGEYREPRIVGYEASNQVSALLRDIERVGAVIDAVFESGANSLDGVQFLSSEADSARDEARRAAVAELGALRDLYAQAAGFEIVRLINFSESGGGRPMPMAMARMESMDAATPVAPGELAIEVTVNASWEIDG
ncbi:MAG: SIMPL domain-containing protein [Oceanicaulis sp.]